MCVKNYIWCLYKIFIKRKNLLNITRFEESMILSIYHNFNFIVTFSIYVYIELYLSRDISQLPQPHISLTLSCRCFSKFERISWEKKDESSQSNRKVLRIYSTRRLVRITLRPNVDVTTWCLVSLLNRRRTVTQI